MTKIFELIHFHKNYYNNIAHYIYDNFYESLRSFSDLSDESILSVYSSNNYEFFQCEIDGNMIFFSLCKNEYTNLIDHYLSIQKEEIEHYLSQFKEPQIKSKISKVLKENKLDVAYYLLLGFNCIKKNYFKFAEYIKK